MANNQWEITFESGTDNYCNAIKGYTSLASQRMHSNAINDFILKRGRLSYLKCITTCSKVKRCTFPSPVYGRFVYIWYALADNLVNQHQDGQPRTVQSSDQFVNASKHVRLLAHFLLSRRSPKC